MPYAAAAADCGKLSEQAGRLCWLCAAEAFSAVAVGAAISAAAAAQLEQQQQQLLLLRFSEIYLSGANVMLLKQQRCGRCRCFSNTVVAAAAAAADADAVAALAAAGAAGCFIYLPHHIVKCPLSLVFAASADTSASVAASLPANSAAAASVVTATLPDTAAFVPVHLGKYTHCEGLMQPLSTLRNPKFMPQQQLLLLLVLLGGVQA